MKSSPESPRLGAAVIGNATLIAYDDGPILAADPWFGDEDPAYFGSWALNHKIPDWCKRDIAASKFLWFSHGHPDHLNPLSIKRFVGKKVLLPDHVGARIAKGLLEKGCEVEIIPDRRWVKLSQNVRVHCVTTVIQDAILIIDVGGTAFADLNDAGTRHCTRHVRSVLAGFKKSYLLALSGYGDADMINFFDEDGKFVVPPAKNNVRVGHQLTLTARAVGATGVIPFSSHHQYQRTDSLWAQDYVTPPHAYKTDLAPELDYVEPFSIIDCGSGETRSIDPAPLQIEPKPPEAFGDNWSQPLEKGDLEALERYFRRKERVARSLSFINLRVGGRDHAIKLDGRGGKGITFSAPRQSLMQAVNYEIFDDLLIGNFMKTTLHGMRSLYDEDFNFNVSKYADNGRAQTEKEVRAYLAEYRRRAGREYLYETFLDKAKDMAFRVLSGDRGSPAFRWAKKVYYSMK
jgi:hypothetical protein